MRLEMLATAFLCLAVFCRAADTPEDTVQAGVTLTVAEGKRLIGKAVAEMPVVKRALRDGMVIVARGTTNTYVAEALLGRKIEHGALVSGRVYPAEGGKRLKPTSRMAEIVLVKGEASDLSFADAVKKFQPGDVMIKGANALDYERKTVGVLIGAPNSGTTGTFMPYVIARKVHLVIPVGLEKQVSMPLDDLQRKMREPIESLGSTPSLFPLTGHIVTEIEALKLLAAVEVFQAAAGGVGGAEGGVWLVLRGRRADVQKALDVVKSVRGEPPFVE